MLSSELASETTWELAHTQDSESAGLRECEQAQALARRPFARAEHWVFLNLQNTHKDPYFQRGQSPALNRASPRQRWCRTVESQIARTPVTLV